MSDPIITCPNCKTEIKLTEQLAGPLLAKERRQYEQSLAHLRASFEGRQSELREREAALSQAGADIENVVALRVQQEQARIASEAERKARVVLHHDLEGKQRSIDDLTATVGELMQKLSDAQNAQAELTRDKRRLDQEKQALKLTVEQRVQEQVSTERQRARQEAERELALKLIEKDRTVAAMKEQLSAAQRKAEQGSQQLQGEAQEIELETLLRARFRNDELRAVPKGELGADVVQRVIAPAGQYCGTILWESKRTKSWSDGWLPKLREDQRAAKAEIAVIVSHALPKNTETFDLIDGVYVSSRSCAIPVAVALRESLIALSMARQTAEGRLTKTQLVYTYLTGPEFRQRVEAIVERFSEMRRDLEHEKKAMQKLWAKREKLIDGILSSTAGMYGDLQGITARSLQEIEELEFPMLDAPEAA